jgi:phage shock protein E
MVKPIWKLCTLLLVIVMAVAGCGGSQSSAPAQQAEVAQQSQSLPVNIDAKTLNGIRDRDDVVVLDVREDWEYAESHIPGAVLLPLNEIPDRMSEIPTDKTVVAVCRSGNRSNQATQFLRQRGFDNVHNMQGGMLAWDQAGFPVN